MPQVQIALFALLAIACLSGAALGRSLKNHLRNHHPKVYARFGYPQSKPGWRLFDGVTSKEEEQGTRADWDFWWTVYRGELNRIQDERLHALLRRWRAVFWTAMALMVALFLTIVFTKESG